MPTFMAKLVILGPHSSGKTSMVTRYQSNIFHPTPSCTIGASFSNVNIETDEFKVKLQVWDTAGQERFRSMTPMYYRGAHGAILVFDLTDAESLGNLKLWVDDLLSQSMSGDLVLALAGNKCDLVHQRCVTEKEGKKYAKEIGAAYFETSAKVNSGIGEIFDFTGTSIGEKMMKNKNQKNKEQNIPSRVLSNKEVSEAIDSSSSCCR